MTIFIWLFLVIFSIGGVLPYLPWIRPWGVPGSRILAGVGSLLALICGIQYAIAPMGEPQQLIHFLPMPEYLPPVNLTFYADRFASLFLILTGGLSFAAVLHMVDWLRDVHESHRIVSTFNVFVLAIVLTILADNVYFYLLFLEMITLAFAYLALFRHNLYLEKGEVPPEKMTASKTAFQVYLIFEHTGVVLLALALIILSVQPFTGSCPGVVPDGSPLVGLEFAKMRCAGQQAAFPSGLASNLVFLLALAGLGIKAGMFPAYIWVPMVHPYSPTSIHAMMSGIVLKVAGIYGMYRIFFQYLGHVEWWWGLLVVLLAALTALMGVFYALAGRDLKTALASHSVENIGIILAGLGLALIYRWAAIASAGSTNRTFFTATYGFQMLEVLALVASLYHLINHSIFKSLLFFSAGAIENRTGTTELEKLGGLMKRYPWTCTCFLVGAAAISGFPPFNGFISEWLTLQAFFAGSNLFLPSVDQRIIFLVGGVLALLLLALAFGLTALAFVKISGEALLGMPRDADVARRSRPGEAPWHIRSVLVTLAALCLVLGLFPGAMVRGLTSAVQDFHGSTQTDRVSEDISNLTVSLKIERMVQPENTNTEKTVTIPAPVWYNARVSGYFLWIVVGVLALPFIVNQVFSRFRRTQRLRLKRGPLWTGGVPYQPETMQYTGPAFSSPVWLPFEARGQGEGAPVNAGAPEYLPSGVRLTGRRNITEVLRLVSDRAVCLLLCTAQKLGDQVQNGDIRRYLFYIFVLFVLVLAALVFSGTQGIR